MYGVFQRKVGTNEVKCVEKWHDFLSASDRAQAFNEDMEDDECAYFAAKIKEKTDSGQRKDP